MSLAAIVFGAFLSNSGTSWAGLTLDSSSGTIAYAVFSTGTNNDSPAFNSNMLVYPGGGLPVLQGVVPETSTQNTSASTLSPFFLSTATTSSSPNGSVPSTFGSATTEVYTSTSGNQGGFTSQGGVFWSLSTNLGDNLPDGSNRASVSFSTAVATYTNNTGASISITPGAILSVNGSLGSDPLGPTYVAAGLSSSYTVFGAGVDTSTTALDSIILAASSNGINIASKGNGAKEFASVTVAGNKVSGTGTSLNPTSIILLSGESITISSALTLISDPGSDIGITTDLAPGFPTDPTAIPDFGVFAASTSVASVPEPSSFVLLGAGLTMAGLWTRSNRRRATAKL